MTAIEDAQPESNRRLASVLLITASAFLWGTSFPAIKIALGGAGDEVSFSFLISFLRISMAAVIGIVALAAARRMDAKLFREPLVWVLGALNATSFAAQHMGLAFTTASKTALLVNFNVVFVAVFSFFFFGERFSKRKGAGVALGVAGVAVVATRLDPSFLSQGQLSGDALAFSAGFFWSLYILYTKKAIDRGLDYIGLSVAALATTAVFLLIPLPFVNVAQPVDATGWGGIVYLGLVSTLLPLILWSRALKGITATVSSILLLLEVLFAVLLSVLILGEAFLPAYVLGGALILGGGVLSATTEARRAGRDAGGSAQQDPIRR